MFPPPPLSLSLSLPPSLPLSLPLSLSLSSKETAHCTGQHGTATSTWSSSSMRTELLWTSKTRSAAPLHLSSLLPHLFHLSSLLPKTCAQPRNCSIINNQTLFFSWEWGLGTRLSFPLTLILPPPPLSHLPPSINPQSGETALHVSARYGHPEVLAFLCHSGATLNVQDKVLTNDNVIIQQ